MPTRNVDLTEHLDRFIETGITSGRFSNASEVVREGLRLLEQREEDETAKLEWLRKAAKEGFDDADRGDYVTLSSDQEIDTFVDQVRRDVSVKMMAEKVSGYTSKEA
jgi:antitoxin ParD1/3/4